MNDSIETTETVQAIVESPTDAPVEKRRPRTPRATIPRDPNKPKVTRVKRTGNELVDFKTWLESLDLGIKPGLHVNGAAFTNCVLAVDFGTPKKSVKLTPEQSVELVTRLRSATKTVLNRDVKIGVMSDHFNGIWWTNVV